jgi:hypothetical protein
MIKKFHFIVTVEATLKPGACVLAFASRATGGSTTKAPLDENENKQCCQCDCRRSWNVNLMQRNKARIVSDPVVASLTATRGENPVFLCNPT